MRRKLTLLLGVLGLLSLAVVVAQPANAGSATNSNGACIGYCPGGINDTLGRYSYEPLSTLTVRPPRAPDGSLTPGYWNGTWATTYGYIDSYGAGGSPIDCYSPGHLADGFTPCTPSGTNVTEDDGDIHMHMDDNNGANGIIVEADPSGTLRFNAMPHLTDNLQQTPHTQYCVQIWGISRMDDAHLDSNGNGLPEIHPLLGWRYATASDNGVCGPTSGTSADNYTIDHGANTNSCVGSQCTNGPGTNASQFPYRILASMTCEPLVPCNGHGTDLNPRGLTDAYVKAVNLNSDGSYSIRLASSTNLYPVIAHMINEEYFGGQKPQLNAHICAWGNLHYLFTGSGGSSRLEPFVGWTNVPAGGCSSLQGA